MYRVLHREGIRATYCGGFPWSPENRTVVLPKVQLIEFGTECDIKVQGYELLSDPYNCVNGFPAGLKATYHRARTEFDDIDEDNKVSVNDFINAGVYAFW